METKKEKIIVLLSLAFVLMGASRCAGTGIKYEDDIGFLNSAQANSMEYMVKIGGKVCKDLDGKIGACTKRIRSDRGVTLCHDKRPYSYRLHLRCSSGTGIGFSVDIQKNKKWEYTIPHEKFKAFRSFSCVGEIFPQDRKNNLSATWQIRFIVVDKEYHERERIYHTKKHIVLGKHALYSTVCSKGKCKTKKKKTVVKAPKTAKAYSESKVMRYNYYGF